MRALAVAFSTVVLSVVGASAQAQISARPNISVADAQVFCQGIQPFVSLTLPIGVSDVGRPGLLYVGMRDAGMSQAAFFTNGSWLDYQGGLFPVYSVASSGLSNSQMLIPLPPNLAGGGWTLYVGYGALSTASESQVQAAITAIEAAKAINAAAAVATVDPYHYRRTLIQNDMTTAGKFAYVNTGVENNSYVCQPRTGGEGQ